MIADYGFYTMEYFGDQIPEDDFPKYATRADAYLNELTMGRYADDSLSDNIKKAVKMAECAIAEQCFSTEQSSVEFSDNRGGTLASESVGAHSVSYRSGEELRMQLASGAKRVAQQYLLTTGLLYRGIPVCTHHIL